MAVIQPFYLRADSNSNLTGQVQLISGSNITLTQSGQTITIASTGSGSMSIGGTVTSGTTGSMLYIAAGPVLAQSNSALFFTLADLSVQFSNTAAGSINSHTISGSSIKHRLTVASEKTGTDIDDLVIWNWSSTASQGPRLAFIRSKGTQASPTIVAVDDELMMLSWQGADSSSDYEIGGMLQAFVDATPGSNDLASRLTLSLTKDGTASPVESVTFKSNQQINIGVTRTTPVATNDAVLAYMPTYTDNANFTSNVLYFAPTITASGTVTAARSFMHVGGSVTVTSVNYTAPQSVILVDMTVTANTAVGTAPNVTLFDSMPTYDWKQIVSGGSTYYTFNDHPTFQASGLGNTSTVPPIIATVYSAPILKSTVAATTTMRITARYAIDIEDINYADTTGFITVDNNTGVYISDFVVGTSGNRTVTTAIGVNSFLSAGTSKYFIRHEGTGGTYAQSIHGGKIRFGDTTDPTQVVEVLGNVYLDNGGTSGELRIREPSAGGSSYAGLKAGALAANAIWTLPDLPGSTQYIQCSSAGVISYTTSTGGTNALLDGTVHNDTVAQTVSRGSLIYGNSTPKWDELVIGSSGKVLTSDGTDASWQTPSAYTLITSKTKPGDESYGALVTGATFHDDADLTGLTIAATGKYVIKGVLFATSASATPDIKINLTVVTSTVNNMNVSVLVHQVGSTTNTDYIQLTASGGSSGLISIGAGVVDFLLIEGTIDVTNAGSVKLQWAQNTANGTQTTLQRGSYLSIYPI